MELRSLESRYRKTVSGAIAAKTQYLALLEEPGSTAGAIKRARSHWETLNLRKREIAARMGEIEDLDQGIQS